MRPRPLILQASTWMKACKDINEVMAYTITSHPTAEKRRAIAIFNAQERSNEEALFLQQYADNFAGYSSAHTEGVIQLHMIIYFYKQLHPARAIQHIIDCFEAKERSDEMDVFLSEHQRLFNGEHIYQERSLSEIIEHFYRIEIRYRNETQQAMIALYEKEDRTDDDDLALADAQYRYNRAIWDDVDKQYQKYGERIW